MKLFIYIILFTAPFSSLSQEKITTYYNAEENKIISKTQFQNLFDSTTRDEYSVQNNSNNNSILQVIYPKLRYGMLSKKKLDSLIFFSDKHSKKSLKSKEFILIHYKHQKNNFNYSSSFNTFKNDTDFIIELNKTINCNSFFIKSSKSNKKQRQNKIKSNKVSFSDFLENNFFMYKVPKNGFVLIRNDGRYLINYGYYYKERVIELAEFVSGQKKKSEIKEYLIHFDHYFTIYKLNNRYYFNFNLKHKKAYSKNFKFDMSSIDESYNDFKKLIHHQFNSFTQPTTIKIKSVKQDVYLNFKNRDNTVLMDIRIKDQGKLITVITLDYEKAKRFFSQNKN
jgi:hypothetical protein